MNKQIAKDNPPERLNLDGRTFGENGQPDTFTPRDFWRKLVFFLFSIGIVCLAVWELWGPTTRFFAGERGVARVISIERQSPGESLETIRIKKEIKEGDYANDTIFRYFVEVLNQAGDIQLFEMAVASRSVPYALVNESFEVIYFPGDEYAYGLWHHRTWAIGFTLLFVGVTFTFLSGYLLWMVGKPIEISPESEEALEQERKKQAEDEL